MENALRRGAGCVVMLAALAAEVSAQRATCHGVVRDGDGAPLVGAEVTCVQEPGQVPGESPDRVAVRTDAAGQFRADLLLGSPYVAWVIGPPAADGTRLIAGPEVQAAAGKRLDLVADQRGAPARFEVRGAAPWLPDGPLALRMMVGGQFALGPDVPFPGDIALTLGPWPDGEGVLALVDGKGQVIERVLVRPSLDREIDFTPARELAVYVSDDRGKPISGASIGVEAAGDTWSLTARDVLPIAWRSAPRVAGRTDARGRANVRVPWADDPERRDLTLVATHPGFGASQSGYVSGSRYCDSQPGGDDEDARLWFVLQPRAVRRLEIKALDPSERALVEFAVRHTFSTGTISGVGDLVVPVEVRDGVASAQTLARALGVGVGVRRQSHGKGPPRRVVTLARGGADGDVPGIDLSTMRRHLVTVTDARGAPVPCAHFAVTSSGPGLPRRWFDRCVADAQGRVVLLSGADELRLIACAGVAAGVLDLAAGAAAGDVRIRLAPFPSVRLRVLDIGGRPVAGARLAHEAHMRPIRGEADTVERSRLSEVCWALLRAARSDRSGLIELPLPASAVEGVVLRLGVQRSQPLRITASGEVIDVVVQ